MKRRILRFAALLVIGACALTACDLLEECGTCELITVHPDGSVENGTPLPFCGDNLAEKQNSAPVTVGGTTTYWDCY